ncbi:universal stress protein UspA-like protein [Cryptosporangium arvum DSM 44712]|uniref:Universal stress protein UspA-like protein n=1 Tax=Cryptosporangium arvum DSM 44712 TaxID=927661 RepID=A0A010ZTL9_9ACTN|nr:universal stress protein UspA-like protein [Cryptosporangium arvum DSM 44712]
MADSRLPVDALVAQSGHADLLVLGTHGWGGLAGLVHGSVTQDAFARANCPIVVIREPHDRVV